MKPAAFPVQVHSFDEWRAASRTLLAQPDPHIPARLLALLEVASCCRDPGRWSFLYLVLARWQRGEQHVLHPSDADGRRLQRMVAAVRRSERQARACIRFHERSEEAGAPRFVAWCDPAHDVLPLLARHFATRFEHITWMIATPAASVLWDGSAMHHTGPLWGAFCLSILSPARLHADLVAAAGALDGCRRCPLWEHATQAVPGQGPVRAAIMLVGEQPGDQEDRAGMPFVGPAGKLLERALAQAGLTRREVYLTNAVKHFKWTPRGKRRMHKTPAQREVAACGYWLEREFDQVRPQVVVVLGATALRAVTGNPRATLKDTMGKPVRHQGRWIVAAWHPSYVLRVPGKEQKAQAFAVLVAALRQARTLGNRAGEKKPPGANRAASSPKAGA